MATYNQMRYCVERVKSVFENDLSNLRDGNVPIGRWRNTDATRVKYSERFNEYHTTATYSRIVGYDDKVEMETEVFHFDKKGKVDYNVRIHGELFGIERDTAEKLIGKC